MAKRKTKATKATSKKKVEVEKVETVKADVAPKKRSFIGKRRLVVTKDGRKVMGKVVEVNGVEKVEVMNSKGVTQLLHESKDGYTI